MSHGYWVASSRILSGGDILIHAANTLSGVDIENVVVTEKTIHYLSHERTQYIMILYIEPIHSQFVSQPDT